MIHELKCWPEPFELIRLGIKRFEVRVDDRNYSGGDVLVLREWDPESRGGMGRKMRLHVLHIVSKKRGGGPPELLDRLGDLAVMSVEVIEDSTVSAPAPENATPEQLAEWDLRNK